MGRLEQTQRDISGFWHTVYPLYLLQQRFLCGDHIMFHTVRTVVFKHKAAKYHNFSVKLVWEVSLGLVKKIRTTEVITCTFYDFFWRKVLRNLKITRIQRVSKFLSRKVKFSNTRQTNKITGNAMSAISNKEQAVQAVDCDIQWIIPVQHTIYPTYLLY